MYNILFVLPIFLLLIGGIVWLQIYLSKSNNKWLGLILPIINLFCSLVIILFMTPSVSIQTESEIIEVDGVIVSENTRQVEREETGILNVIGTIVPVLLIANIPTLILVAIYYASREKLKIKNQLDKMTIQDLR